MLAPIKYDPPQDPEYGDAYLAWTEKDGGFWTYVEYSKDREPRGEPWESYCDHHPSSDFTGWIRLKGLYR